MRRGVEKMDLESGYQRLLMRKKNAVFTVYIYLFNRSIDSDSFHPCRCTAENNIICAGN